MSNSNGIISAPVSIKDVQEVLGETSNDLATLCCSSKINMWAKFKPVSLGKLFPDRSSTWWKGGSFDCGITVPRTSQVEKVIDFYSEENNGYVYQRPYGGTSSPYRLADFEGYNHNADCPTGEMNTLKSSYLASDEIPVTFITSASGSADSVYLSDIAGLADSYFGCIMLDSSNNLYGIMTSSQKLSEITDIDGLSLGLTMGTNFAVGNYKIVPVLSSVPYTAMVGSAGVSSLATYYPLPTGKVQSIEIKSPSTSFFSHITVVGVYYPSEEKVEVTITTETGGTWSGVIVYLSSNNDYSGVTDQWNVGTLNANRTYTHTFTGVTSASMKSRLLIYDTSGYIGSRSMMIGEVDE